jgi:WD40 repeat protein
MNPNSQSSKHQAVRAAVCLFIAACSLLALAGCARQSSQAPSPTGSPVAGALQTPTPLAATPGPSIPAPLPTSTPYPTSTPPNWPALAGNAVLPAPLYLLSDGAIDRIEKDGTTRGPVVYPAVVYPGAYNYDVSPVDGTVVLAGQGRLWLSRGGSTYPTLLLVGLPNPEATDDCYDIRNPVWSPDGRYIAYADGGIRIWDIALSKRIDLAEIPVQTEEYLIPWTFYGTCYEEPRWSPAGDAILFLKQQPDARTLMLVTLEDKEVRAVPGPDLVRQEDVAWSSDGKALLFYCWRSCFPEIRAKGPSFVRVALADPETREFLPLYDRVDQAYVYGPKNPPRAAYPFETPDGRILYFLEDECDTRSCYSYSLMEGVITQDGFNVHVLHKNVLPDAVDNVTWHESGKYIAFVVDRDENPTIALLRVDTGEIFTVSRREFPPFYLRWGKQ